MESVRGELKCSTRTLFKGFTGRKASVLLTMGFHDADSRGAVIACRSEVLPLTVLISCLGHLLIYRFLQQGTGRQSLRP